MARTAVVRFKRNSETGAITPPRLHRPRHLRDHRPGLVGGSGIDLSADGKSIYVTSTRHGVIAHLRRGRGGTLLSRGCIQDADTAEIECARVAEGLGGARSVVVGPDDASVYVAGSDDFAIAHFARAARGHLTEVGCVDDDDLGASSCAQSAPGLALPLNLALSPDGTSLYSTSHLDHAVTLLSRDVTDGTLTPNECFEAPGGPDACTALDTGPSFATSLATSPDGESVYVGSGQGDAILHLARDAAGGLTFSNCIEDNRAPDAVQCAQTTNGLNGPAWLTVSDDGAHVYSTSREDAVLHFSRDVGP